MYVHHAEVDIFPEQFDKWSAHAHNYVSVMSRKPGLAVIRGLRSIVDPHHVVFVETWRSKEDCAKAQASIEAGLVATAIRRGELVRNERHREFGLHDMVWGRRGLHGFSDPAQFVRHIEVDVFPEKFAQQWVPWVRNFLSVFARQKGVLAEEILRSTTDPYHLVAIRTYVNEAAALAKPSIEEETAANFTKEGKVYAKPPSSITCSLFDIGWGLTGQQDIGEFMMQMESV